MRKITFLFCVLMIVPTLTLANSDMVSVSELRQQAEAMGRWTKTYEAHGRTIEVDVPIIVPEVEEFPVFLVEPYYAVYEQRLTRDGTMLEKIGEDGRCSVYAESNLLSEEGIIGKARVLDLDDFEQVDFDANYSSPRDEHNLNTKYTSEFFYPYEIEQADTYAEDNPASLEDAVANMEKVVGYFYPEEPAVMVDRVELRSRLHKVKGIDDYNLGDYVEDYPSGTYNLSIREMMDGIPIYVDVGLAPIFDFGYSLTQFYTRERAENVSQLDVMRDVPVANYIGTSSLFRNLELMPERIKLPPLLPEHRAEILRGLDGILSQEHLDKTWEMISRRYAYYEAL